MSDITITPPSIVALSVSAPNVLALEVLEKENVVLTVGDVTVGAVTLSGDVTGDSGANTVFAIRGNTVQGAPATGSFLRYSGALWANVLISTYVKTSYYSTLLADRSLSNSSTTTQNVFATPQDTFALEANSVYAFEGSYVIAAGTTTHTTAIGFSEFGNGSCHFTCIAAGINSYGGVQRAQDMTMFATSIGGPINTTSTQTYTVIKFTGRITVVDATNFTPTLTFSAGPTGTCATKAGSWIKVTKLWTGATTIADPEWT
jgi:hypothetical protein